MGGEGPAGPKGMPCVVGTGYKYTALAIPVCLPSFEDYNDDCRSYMDVSSKATKPTAAFSVLTNYYLYNYQWYPSLSSRKDALSMATFMQMFDGSGARYHISPWKKGSLLQNFLFKQIKKSHCFLFLSFFFLVFFLFCFCIHLSMYSLPSTGNN